MKSSNKFLIAALLAVASATAMAQGSGGGNGNGGTGGGNAHGAATAGMTSGGDPASGAMVKSSKMGKKMKKPSSMSAASDTAAE